MAPLNHILFRQSCFVCASIDAIESARFIPKEKSAALVKKIGSLTSFHNTEKLVRNVDVENRIKIGRAHV